MDQVVAISSEGRLASALVRLARKVDRPDQPRSATVGGRTKSGESD